jgi:hypothetical protein
MLILGRIFSNDCASTNVKTSLMGKVFIIVQVILECNDSADTSSFANVVKLKDWRRSASVKVEFRWRILSLWFHRIVLVILSFAHLSVALRMA